MIQFLVPLAAWALWVNVFFYRPMGVFGFWLFVTGTLVLLRLSLGKRDKTVGTWLVGALGVLGLEMMQVSNGAVDVLLVLTVMVVGGLGLYSMVSRLQFVRSITEVIEAPFRLFGAYVVSVFRTVTTFSFEPISKHIGGSAGPLIKTVFGGLVVGVPICGILLFLLTNADPIFARTLSNWWQGWPTLQLSDRAIWTMILCGLFVPILRMRILVTHVGSLGNIAKWIGSREAGISAFLVALVMGLFLIIQAPYIFANRIPDGVVTYSEYVRKGFVELLFVAIVIYGSLGIGYIAYRRAHAKPLGLLGLQGLVGIEFLIFVVSVLRRVWLYQLFHGWSLVRIYGSVFLVWVIGMTVILGLRHVKQMAWVKWELGFTLAMVVLLGAWNTEDWMVRINPPRVNNQVDYMYLSRLSADGYIGWTKALSWAEKIMTVQYGQTLAAEDRRVVAYSAEILRQLSGKYDHLIRIYGTEEEKRAYFDQLRIEVAVQDQLRLDFVLKHGENAWLRDTLIGNLAWLRAGQSVPVTEIASRIHMSTYPSEFELGYTFYILNDGPILKSADFSEFDRLLVGSWSEQRAYEFMNSAHTIQTLWRLQRLFVPLQLKVLDQPESERSVYWDVSRETPLLLD